MMSQKSMEAVKGVLQECEISKFSHASRTDFSFFLLSLCTLRRTFLTCPTLGSSRILERLCHFFPSLWSLAELSQHRCNLCQCWCCSALVSLGKGDLPEARAFCIPAKQDVTSPWAWGELSALFPGAWKSRRCSQCTPCLGTTCLCEQKERWRTSRLKRNPTSIINEGVPMDKNIVLISLLDASKVLVIAGPKFQIVCFSLSESRWIFCLFSVTLCHPQLFPAALCRLSCSAASLPCLPSFFYI